MTQKEKVKRFREIVTNMADLYEKKNSNYGDSFGKLYSDLGPVAGLVPLHNKLDRATSLVQGEKNNFESLEDTFKDLACYAIMNLIEMEAQKDKECCSVSALPEYVECEVYKLHRQTTNCSFTAADCYGCKHTSCPYNRPSYVNLCGAGEPIKTAYGSTDPCEGCDFARTLKTTGYYVGDTPCQWCNKNPYKLSCGTATTSTSCGTYDHSAYETIVKGSNSNEK